MSNLLIVVVGTTAIGKTAKAIELAKHYGCEIISCDSRQFFSEMNIGTAVPSPEELAVVPHHFIRHISIFDRYNVGDFEREALTKLEELFLKNPIQVMVGGSGLYVDAVVKGFDDFPDIAPEIRVQIREAYQEHGLEYLQETLKVLDPIYYKKLLSENPQTLENPQRMMRFIEISKGSKFPYSHYLNKKKNNRNFEVFFVGLEAEREIIYDRINQRVDLMMQNGLLEEARGLYPYRELNALQTVGYRELFEYFEGRASLEFAVEEIKKNTRRFAKRQITWFKRDLSVNWFDYRASVSEITAKILWKKDLE